MTDVGNAAGAGVAARSDGRVKIEEGVEFGVGGGRALRCDVFRPPEPRPDGRSVLLLHGGGWARGDRSQLRGYGVLLGRLGYLCVSAEYRLSGESKWPAQIHDVKACLRFMRRESGALGIDPDQIVVSGNSAGGHLALMLAATPDHPDFEGAGGSPGLGTAVRACVAFYPPTFLAVGPSRDGMVGALFERDASEEVIRAASPLHYAGPGFPPTLLLHGNDDQVVSPRASLEMYQALRQAGARAELHLFGDAPHGFDAGRALGRESAQLIHLFLERHA